MWFVFIILLFLGCASYYQRNLKFQQFFSQGKIEEAEKELNKNKDAAKDKNRLLYFMQKGVVLQMLGKHEESNQFFEQAYIFTEDIQKNYAAEAFSLLSNPETLPYRGEDFELVLIHYYKALNFLRMGMPEEAQVECRRINIKLNQLNDKYGNHKNRYKRDAFALNLMGIIFESSGDINSAFVSYRNAYEAYKEDYAPLFGVEPPLQLKKDLQRTAYLLGFTKELDQYEKEFGMRYLHQTPEGGELLFFWNNGLGPVKAEWSINFFIVKGAGGLVTFVNEDEGFSFPFSLKNSDDALKLKDLKAIRITVPKYSERSTYFRKAELLANNNTYPFEVAENINEIAFKTLQDRMIREFATSLLRAALKQVAEEAVRKKNEGLGALLSIANALTEKADTRNWQTLPYSISYARVPLPEGKNSIDLKCYSPHGSEIVETFEFDIKSKKTLYFMYHTMESMP
ncbi:MAG: hypothetical protein JXB48_13920 [Candidatus Latescibacteria bacterium]|nr:hypothetical protein [Candidatus Latescibacterota bacterium]